MKKYVELLHKVGDIMSRAGYDWFFMSGTLLSIIRGNIIPGDIDVGILNETQTRGRLIDIFIKNGFTFVHGFGSEERGRQDTVKYGDLTVDLHKIYKTGKTMYHCAWDGEGTNWTACEMVRYDFAEFETVEYREGFRIPESPSRYLIQHFGSDWKRPATFWHFAKSCPNAWYTGLFMPKIKIFGEL